MKTRHTDSEPEHRQPTAALVEREAVRAAVTGRRSALQVGIDESPRMLAQRRLTQALFGSAFQRRVDGGHIERATQPRTAPVVQQAQGSDIHLGPGQEHHLPHGAWRLGQGVDPGSHGAAAMPVQRVREFGFYGRDGKKKNRRVIGMEEFGDRNRIHRVEPNKVRERLPGEDVAGMGIQEGDVDKKVGIWRPSKADGSARPEDPPIYQPFRKAFHEAHNIKLALERDVEGFPAIDLKEGFTTRLLGLASRVKKISIEYKALVRNFGEAREVSALKEEYFVELDKVTVEVKELSTQMLKSSMGPKELNSTMERLIKVARNEAGGKIWRDRWWAAVQEINRRLLGLWTAYKQKIREWVSGMREKGLSYMDPDNVGDLDYIGSLAKGYKSAPKQYIRFMPENFDVDANLDAPPLAVYAMSQGAKVDRGSVRGKGIAPLEEFVGAANGALFGVKSEAEEKFALGPVPGLDKDDPFEVFIRATNVSDIMFGSHEDVDAAHRQEALSRRLQDIQDRIWWLRGRNMDLSRSLGKTLAEQGFVTDEGTIKDQPYTDTDLIFMEVLLFEAEEKLAKIAGEAQQGLSSGEGSRPARVSGEKRKKVRVLGGKVPSSHERSKLESGRKKRRSKREKESEEPQESRGSKESEETQEPEKTKEPEKIEKTGEIEKIEKQKGKRDRGEET